MMTIFGCAKSQRLSSKTLFTTSYKADLKDENATSDGITIRSDANQSLELYIRNQFEVLYQYESVDTEVIEVLTNDLLSELQQQNNALIKEISLQKITDTINKLPNYKAPGSDGLIYEAY
ncbi:42250_t:CDS:2, partial [Gigaspora margarita]